ncbi:lysM and putative peptidoglycan-binding domain-containing protein 4 [Apteryx mantelli]|uniref:LysM and putative peptidoglycan-binding domain-containing protein 4 n=1 Tax=Apteryx mantelli TaxID=2696672 RepID=A0A8B7JLA4_9AVES|nr:PREDICTED: lysM and putative peptidoglycan-binding domain-containing protein 4 [Apteryx mantelli mantelli]XP_013811836.1 PREDICTED: lysM and putative peptidoglycan-binding domain-containing protein 4 [Apteryx mantelli mantelli]XP_013811837.1 PREDICTED: lysM and putative peptidoglycan-binding domain-containing protein 4 [Apteryx mantelli mantelli]XP_013811838.1 PREDICTED: lysM and putative peptidoglycan-binding domain-containing protein 4 [Apteryx mantelli mantelli]XP_013811839.1 PREDICTED: l
MRLNESRTRSLLAPVTIHNYPGNQVYVFQNGHSDSEELSEEELNVTELRPRGKEQQRCSAARDKVGDVVLLEREITQDDNLNKLALQYGCKVADIKRVNNFIREQDLYALKSIKIPVKTHGLLTETGQELRPLQTARSQAGLTLVDMPEPDDGAAASTCTESRYLNDYFKGIDKSIQDAVQAEVQLNADYCVEALEKPLLESGKQETSNGADCGIQWWNAVFIMLLIGIVLPVFYITYFKTQENGATAHTSNTTLTSNISADGLEGKLPQNLVVEEIPKGGSSRIVSPPSTEVHKPVTLTVVESGG